MHGPNNYYFLLPNLVKKKSKKVFSSLFFSLLSILKAAKILTVFGSTGVVGGIGI